MTDRTPIAELLAVPGATPGPWSSEGHEIGCATGNLGWMYALSDAERASGEYANSKLVVQSVNLAAPFARLASAVERMLALHAGRPRDVEPADHVLDVASAIRDAGAALAALREAALREAAEREAANAR